MTQTGDYMCKCKKCHDTKMMTKYPCLNVPCPHCQTTSNPIPPLPTEIISKRRPGRPKKVKEDKK